MSIRITKYRIVVDDNFTVVAQPFSEAGETLTIDVFDSIATSEYIDQLLGKYFISTNEAIEINEATSERLPKVSLDVADSVDTSESIDRLLDKYFVGTHESLEVDELFASKIPILKLSIADSVTVLDFNTLRTPKFKLSVSDTIGTAEVIGRHEKSFLDLSENIDIAEFIQLVLKRLLISESDNLSVAEFDELLKSGGFNISRRKGYPKGWKYKIIATKTKT